MQVLDSVRAKGPAGYVRRVGSIGARFGLSVQPMVRRLDAYAALTSRFGVRPTFPITAVVLSRHPELVRAYSHEGVEFAVHGLVHDDHRTAPDERKAPSIARAVELFHRARVPVTGFRAPYLRADAATLAAVQAAGLTDDSSQTVHYDVLPSPVTAKPGGGWQRALDYYTSWDAARTSVRPRLVDGLVTVPVALPDDEIMVDRLSWKGAQLVGPWLAVLEEVHRRGEVFTVQLHPERFDECAEGLTAVLHRRGELEGGCWAASLGEMCDWWRERAAARVVLQRPEPGRWRAVLDGSPRTVLETVGGPGAGSGPGGEGAPGTGRELEEESDLEPVVGVTPEVARRWGRFLAEEGFLVREDLPPQRCAVHLGDELARSSDEQAVLRRVLEAPAPVVRLARWPGGARSALVVSGDIDSLTLNDFLRRQVETRRGGPVAVVPRARDGARPVPSQRAGGTAQTERPQTERPHTEKPQTETVQTEAVQAQIEGETHGR